MIATLSYAAQEATKTPSRPDVFLITIDTLRADHVRCYGDLNIHTPAIDQLAHDGILFRQAFTPSPITNSSHVTIMTGLLPSHHGVTDFGVQLSSEHATLAELLKAQGYQTAAFIGSVMLDSNTLAPGLDHGFSYYDNFPRHNQSKSRWGRIERRGTDVVQRAEAWMQAHPKGPRFVWIHLYDPHDPYEPPPPYSAIYKDRLYDGEIAYADSALGNFLSFLQRQRRYVPSLIVVTGDHGEGLGEHGEQTHGIFLYDSTTHVPLLIKPPGKAPSNHFFDGPVRTTDVLPTILDLLQVTVKETFDGVSLKGYLDGAAPPSLVLFGETNYPLSFGWAPLRSVREGGFKLVEAPRPELYDLRSDPRETSSIYQPWNQTVLKMRDELAQKRKTFGNSAGGEGAVAPGTVDELRALGYLHSADELTVSNVAEPSLLPDPKDKIAEFNLLHAALLDEEDGRLSAARAALDKVLRTDPNSLPALEQAGDLEMKARHYEKAAAEWKRVSAAKPGDASAQFKYGWALKLDGDEQQASEALQASLKIQPEQYQARMMLGDTCLQLKQLECANDQLQAALLLQPSFEASLDLAKVMVAQKRYSAAIEQLKETNKTWGAHGQAYELMAQAYAGLNQDANARQARQRAALLRRR
jgi:choline-sulfatase